MTYTLALELKMTVAELRQRMSSLEFMRWLVFLKERSRRENESIRRATRRC